MAEKRTKIYTLKIIFQSFLKYPNETLLWGLEERYCKWFSHDFRRKAYDLLHWPLRVEGFYCRSRIFWYFPYLSFYLLWKYGSLCPFLLVRAAISFLPFYLHSVFFSTFLGTPLLCFCLLCFGFTTLWRSSLLLVKILTYKMLCHLLRCSIILHIPLIVRQLRFYTGSGALMKKFYLS